MNFGFTKSKGFKYEILGIISIFVILYIYLYGGGDKSTYILVSGILGLAMAINIGANDVANNMGPAVGSKALTITGAIIIAAIFEASGVMIAGGDVVDTIKKGIINPDLITEPIKFVAIMMGTLAGAAIWVTIATIYKAPVSTTHSIVGGLIGGGLTSAGTSIVDWMVVSKIAASWVISPVMGGVIASILLVSISKNILKQEERGEAAKIWVPIYIGIMIWTFSTYLILKGFKLILKGSDFGYLLEPKIALFVGYVLGVITFIGLRVYYKKQSSYFKNSKKFINRLFNIPLIFSVALLSFAHGANDVANAIGPLAAIVDSIQNGSVAGGAVGIPTWVMILGAIGLVLGLSVFGARLIKTVGGEITKLNQIRAFCVALSAAITVIIASQLGLPVSSTHIALGGIFGVGLLREYQKRQKGKDKEYIEKSMIKNIAMAWIITLPASALISSITYLIIMKLS